MVKRLILLCIPLLIVIAAVFVDLKANENETPPPCCVKVVQDAQPNTPVNGAEVVWYQNGQRVERLLTGTDGPGRTCAALQEGYYDIYVYYPPSPNNNQGGQLLNHYHHNNNDIVIMLSPPY
ncbi:MAG: hypothetical protein N2510_06455 [Ignavibacteria bacterium]|nr:hypothetical protein [Ignavibacteria bacterium]